MKTIGLIGGTSWLSTVDYYKLLNELTNEKLGDSNAAKIILYSVNFEEIKKLIAMDDWKTITSIYKDIAVKLENAGADCLVFAANTPHLFAGEIQNTVSIPLIHIAEETAKEIIKQNVAKVALMGTKFVMEKSFFKDKLLSSGISTMIPNDTERAFIHQSIFHELTLGIFSAETKNTYLKIVHRLIDNGAEGIVYACTEIPILLKGQDLPVKTFDTTLIHAKATVAFAASE